MDNEGEIQIRMVRSPEEVAEMLGVSLQEMRERNRRASELLEKLESVGLTQAEWAEYQPLDEFAERGLKYATGMDLRCDEEQGIERH